MFIKPVRSFYLPSGRVIVSKTADDGYFIESTEMRDVSVDGKNHQEVRTSTDPHVIWKHTVDIKDKWLLTVSTQKGCVHSCKFCDVAPLPFRGNLCEEEILSQIVMLVTSTPELVTEGTKKAKIGFARMGEPAHNIENVFSVIRNFLINKLPRDMRITNFDLFADVNLHIRWLPCFNSIIPAKTIEGLTGEEVVEKVLEFKEEVCDGFLHFQVSCNSTNEEERSRLFGGGAVLPLEKVIKIVNEFPFFSGRTVTLNFIVMNGVTIDIDYLMKLGLNPERFAVKLIPLNHTNNAFNNSLETKFNYNTYDELKTYAEKFEKAGIPIVYDAIAKCEESGLCCGQLVQQYQ